MTTPTPGPTLLHGLQHMLKPSTTKEYEKLVLNFMGRANIKRGMSETYDPEVTPIELAEDWIESNDKKVTSKATRSKERTALIWYFSSNEHFEIFAKALKMILPIKPAEKDKGAEDEKNLRRASGRNIPEKDLSKLIKYLEENPGYEKDNAKTPYPAMWGLRCRLYIQATLAAGLRPNEWLEADWTNELKTHINVKSSKAKQIPPSWRSFSGTGEDEGFVKTTLALNPEWMSDIRLPNGELNQTPVDAEYESLLSKKDLPDEQLATLRAWHRHSMKTQYRKVPIKPADVDVIDRHMAMRREFIEHKTTHAVPKKNSEDASKLYYDLCRNVLFLACKSVFKDGRTYSLYDCRSKFSSNTKAEEGRQAAMDRLGHNNARTIGKSYGHIGDADKASKAYGKSRRKAERELLGIPGPIPPSQRMGL